MDKVTVLEIYMVKTKNSTYEIKVIDQDCDTPGSRGKKLALCQKLGYDNRWKLVKADDMEWLEKLAVGPSFDIPGVVTTSMVEDYVRFVPDGATKRRVTRPSTIPEVFGNLADAIVAQAKGGNQHVVVVEGNPDDDFMENYT